MRRVAVLAAALLLGIACGDDEPASPAPNPLLGTWDVVELDGAAASGTWTFGDGSVVIDYGTVFNGTYSYDETASPARLDLMIDGEPTNLAIYGLQGSSVLVLKVQDGATGRATDFSIEGGYDLFRMSRTP